MKTLTLEQFKNLPFDEIFDTGIIPNSPEGIFITTAGGDLRWVAKKGRINDWAVYCHWDYHSEEWIKDHGDKVTTREYIQRCVNCDPEVLKLYRY